MVGGSTNHQLHNQEGYGHKGEKARTSKLTEAQAREILSRKPSMDITRIGRAVAKEFGIAYPTVQSIWNRRIWNCLDEV